MKKQALAKLVAEKLAEYGAVNVPILVAVSGGVDSMALLDIVRSLVFPENLMVVHVDHGLRKTSAKDARLVAEYCAKYGLSLVVKKVDVAGRKIERGGSVEEVARELRHRALESEAAKVGAVYILLAHHLDDQAETVLFNMVRGASLRGMGGMRELSGRLLRPLLAVGKADLLAYAKQHKLAWAEDYTNKDSKYTRNFIRLKVLPLLAGINPRVVAQLGALASDVSAAEGAVRDLARLHVAAMAKATPGKLELPISRLLELTPYMRAEVWKFVAEMLGLPDYEWSSERLRQIEGLVISGEAKVSKRLPGKLLVEKLYDKISISLY